MSQCNDAQRLEALLSRVIYTLNFQRSEDPILMLPIAQVRFMRALLRGPRTVTDLAESFNTSPSAASQLISRLVSASLVNRLDDPKDRRVRLVRLTEKGQNLIQSRHEKRTDNAQKMLNGLGEERSNRLLDILAELEPVCIDITAKASLNSEELASASQEELPS